MSNSVTVLDDRIELATSLQDKSAFYAIGNGKFLSRRKRFIFPKTPRTAFAINTAFKELNLNYARNDAFKELYFANQKITDVQRWKHEDATEQPEIRTTDAWQHQLNAYHFGKDLQSVMFWMGVGTGKSKTAIDILQNNEARRILIVCPPYINRDEETWEKQLDLYMQDDYWFLRLTKGSVRRKAEDAQAFLNRAGNETAIISINYESVWRPEFAEFILDNKFDLLIGDEFHKLKSHNSQVATFIWKASKQFKQIIGLTGTVMYANPLDVFGQYRILDSGIFGTSFTRFRSRYADIYEHNGIPIIKGYINQNELVEKIAPITFEVDEKVLNLPEPIHDIRTVELSKDEEKIYREMEAQAAIDLGDKGYSVSTHVLTKIVRLRQITGGSVPLSDWETDETRVHRLGESKKQLLINILEDLPQDEPLVVFARFIMDLQMVREAAEAVGRSYGEISGRAYDKAKWNAGEISVIGVNDSAGEGMDFTRANYGCFFSYDYSIGKFKQCVGRIRRPPNYRFAYFYHLVAKNTIDEEMYKGILEDANLLHKAVDYLRSLRGK